MWVLIAILPTCVVLGFVIGILLDRESSTVRPICDRVVERLLTTHDPVELERSRILVSHFECHLTDRISKWSAERTGGLNPGVPTTSR